MIVGIDVGGTKTHIRVVDESGALDREARDIIVATESWQLDSSLAAQGSIARLLALFAPHLPLDEPATLVVGAHGCDSPRQIQEFAEAIRRDFNGSVFVVNDAQLLGPAAGELNAIALIAGTGSIVVGQDENRAVITAGGHGWMLADPGSGPALARESVRAILDRCDRGEPADHLGTLFMESMGVATPSELSHEFTRRASMQMWAQMASLVFDAAHAGSTDAMQVIDAAAAELAQSVKALLDRGARATAVIAAGGVVTNQPMLEESIRRHIVALSPSMSVSVLRTAPVAGAIALGRAVQSQRTTTQSGG